jgi:GT2 family glycosyltransferase
LIRKSCYADCGLYRYGLAQVTDFDMWIRLCLAYEIQVLPEKLIRFRVLNNEANSSGNRPETRVRGLYEYSRLLPNYQKLSSFDELVRVFPYAEKYYREAGADIDFVLAMVALELKPFVFTEIFGLNLLFDIVSNKIRAEKVQLLYSFDYVSFVALSGRHDVFSRDVVISERDAAVTERDAAVTERDAAVAMVGGMRRSTSWRVTAPLRLLRHLLTGNVGVLVLAIKYCASRALALLPLRLRRHWERLYDIIKTMGAGSVQNPSAINAIVYERCDTTRVTPFNDPLTATLPNMLPRIDIGVVTYNSSKWVDGFVDSLMVLDYPKQLLAVHFIDNDSTDTTALCLQAAITKLQSAGLQTTFSVQSNTGFGAGHNAAMRAGNAPFCLVTNIDLVFEPDALSRVASAALADEGRVAAWELRQKPYEHPKYYDPVTGLTNWNSHACVLLRREAIESVGGYDETFFMYGEDVELSYRLRRAGYLLRYCPTAVVYHYSYDDLVKIKPLQYTGSTFANLYLRLKYGNWMDILAVPFMGLRLLMAPEVYAGSRRAVSRNLFQLARVAPKTLLERKKRSVHFSFRAWDYEMIRNGAALKIPPLQDESPLVTIVTRTYRGRESFLRQALLSVAHQTYTSIEHVVVEDGGSTMREVVDGISRITGRPIQFIGLEKVGRSAAGNAGMSVATGRWCLFLDDDDLLFADHVEVLVMPYDKSRMP